MKIKPALLNLTAMILVAAISNMPNTASAVKTIIDLRWSSPMYTHDVAVSGDGNYIAAVNTTGLYYFEAASPTPLWWYEPPTTLLSIAISSNGEYVAAGDTSGQIHYFNQSTARRGSETTPTWTSNSMGGPIEKGTLAMSANGNYTVVGGTGVSMWYYAECHKRAGSGQDATWTSSPLNAMDFRSVHISADGEHVAGGGIRYGGGGFVAFYTNATKQLGYIQPTWNSYSQLEGAVTDLALSDDGYGLVAITQNIMSLHYWANATTLTDDPNATWTNPGLFSSVDMNANGNKVVAGGNGAGSLHFWGNARGRSGIQPEDWVIMENTDVIDVALSKDGNIIAAPCQTELLEYVAYFIGSAGETLGSYKLEQYCTMASISDDGGTIAIAGPGYDSLYVFNAYVDGTPPAINDVYQIPEKTSVYPDNTVAVFANVTDEGSGVKSVILNYTTGNGTWFTQEMQPYTTDIYNGTIPAFPQGTNITYIVFAEDNADNLVCSEQLGYILEYQVLPELAHALFAFLLTTALTTFACKRRRKS